MDKALKITYIRCNGLCCSKFVPDLLAPFDNIHQRQAARHNGCTTFCIEIKVPHNSGKVSVSNDNNAFFSPWRYVGSAV